MSLHLYKQTAHTRPVSIVLDTVSHFRTPATGGDSSLGPPGPLNLGPLACPPSPGLLVLGSERSPPCAGTLTWPPGPGLRALGSLALLQRALGPRALVRLPCPFPLALWPKPCVFTLTAARLQNIRNEAPCLPVLPALGNVCGTCRI